MAITRKGFGLIELLTVIAIIAVLAAILYPARLRAKASAQQANNLSNLKHLGHALALYANDPDDGIPTWSEYAYDVTNGLPAPSWGVDTPSVMWDSKLAPYVGQGNAPRRPSPLIRKENDIYGSSQFTRLHRAALGERPFLRNLPHKGRNLYRRLQS